MNAIENKRNANLDLIKIVACICVVGLHAVGMGNYTLYYYNINMVNIPYSQ